MIYQYQFKYINKWNKNIALKNIFHDFKEERYLPCQAT